MDHNELLQQVITNLRCLPAPLIVALVSALPILEVRAGVIAGLLLKMPAWEILFWGCLGNCLAITPVLFFLETLSRCFYNNRLTRHVLRRAFEKAQKNERLINKWGALGLTMYVFVPFPGTGAWTATLIAIALNMHRGRALGAIYAGIILCGVLVLALALAGISGFEALQREP